MLTEGIWFEEEPKQQEEQKTYKRRINVDFFTKEAQNINILDNAEMVDLTEKKKTTTKKKKSTTKTKKIGDNDVVVADGADSGSTLSMLENRNSYSDTYEETNNLIKGTLQQMDILQAELTTDLEQVRASRTLKKKYDYITQLGGTISNILGGKITAIRELNKSITDAHNLDFKKFKELKINETDKDDNKTIMDMYKAFISTPVGTYGSQPGPSPVDLTAINMGTNGVVRADILDSADVYAQNFNVMTPEQNMMLMEENPDITTVVKLDDATGQMMFDVINMSTNESIPNTPKPDAMFLDNLTLDRFNHIARDRNLNRTYPLIIINENKALQEY